MKNNNNKGFSLVELLVVVIIIAIIAAIAIPNLLASRRAANDASAVSSLRTIHSAEVTYYANSGNTSYGSMTDIKNSSLIDSALGGGQKSGFNFAIATGAGIYCGSGVPITAGSTGNKNYGVSTDGVIYQNIS